MSIIVINIFKNNKINKKNVLSVLSISIHSQTAYFVLKRIKTEIYVFKKSIQGSEKVTNSYIYFISY